MPAYNPPSQVLFSPVSNYYQGKAIRAGLEEQEVNTELKRKQSELLTQEIADAPSEREAARQAALLQAENIQSQIDKRTRDGEIGELELAAKAMTPLLEDYSNEPDEDKALEAFNKNLPSALSMLSETEQQRVIEAAGPDHVFSHDEVMRTGLGVRMFTDKQEGGEELTRLQDRLADPKLRPEDRPAIEARIAKLTAPALGATEYDVGSGLSKSGLNATTIKFRDKAGQAAVSAMSGVELVNISYQNPASLGKSGAIVQFGNEIYRTAKNLVELTKSPELPASETEKQDEGWTAFDFTETDKSMKKLGLTPIEATRFKAGIYSIAFSAAVGEQGTRPSDKDIQQYIKIYGGDVTGGPSFRATIAQAMERQDNTLKFMAQLNPEIQDAEQTLGVWNNAYSEFKDALGNPETKTTGPKIGDIDGGYRFIGGDPSDRDSWEKE